MNRKSSFSIHYTNVFHSRTRSIQGTPTLLHEEETEREESKTSLQLKINTLPAHTDDGVMSDLETNIAFEMSGAWSL